MRIIRVFAVLFSLLLTACAWNRTSTGHPSDYVEIDNPAATLSPGAPATIWVPRSYVESGVPRGNEVIKMGAEQVVQSIRGPRQEQQGVPEETATEAGLQTNVTVPAGRQPAGAPAYAAPQPSNRQLPVSAPQPYDGRTQPAIVGVSSVRSRIALIEADRGSLVQPLYDNLRHIAVGGILDPVQTAYLAQSANLTNEAERASFSIRLQQEYGVNVAIFLSAPEGADPGKDISADVYDAMGGGLLQKFEATIPQSLGSGKDEGKSVALPATFTEKIRDYLALLPWYGRIIAVEGNRAYIAAGRETGLRINQQLKIYRSGRFMKGLGYAPGDQVGTLVVQGFVGPNGSFGTIREGQGIAPSDIVSVE